MRNSKNTHSANIPGSGGNYHGNGGGGGVSPLGVYGPNRVGGSPLGGVYGQGHNRVGGSVVGGGGHYHHHHQHHPRSALMPGGGGYPPAMAAFD